MFHIYEKLYPRLQHRLEEAKASRKVHEAQTIERCIGALECVRKSYGVNIILNNDEASWAERLLIEIGETSNGQLGPLALSPFVSYIHALQTMRLAERR